MVAGELVSQSIVNGILLGGIYAVAALGLSLVFGIMDIVNLAHGHMLMVGAYVAILVFAATGITPLVGMFIAMGLLFVLGIVLQKVLLKHVVGEGIEQPIIVLFGLALILQNIGQLVLGGDARTADLGIPGSGIDLGFAFMSLPRTVTFVVAVILIGATWAFLQYTDGTGHPCNCPEQDSGPLHGYRYRPNLRPHARHRNGTGRCGRRTARCCSRSTPSSAGRTC